jgi:hypothetical protein
MNRAFQAIGISATSVAPALRFGAALSFLLALFLSFNVPQAEASSTVRLKLITLHCHATEDSTGPDEAYLLVNGRRVLGPRSINDGQSVDLRGLSPIWVNTYARLDLYDQDAGWFDSDDHLGEASVYASMVGKGTQLAKFTKDGANYTLFYEVIW